MDSGKANKQNKVKKVLFVVRSFSQSGAQPLRFRMILNCLREEFDIHVLEIHHDKAETYFENGLWFHKIEYSLPGKFLNFDQSIRNPKTINITHPDIKGPLFFKSKLKREVRKLFFPDILTFEKRRLIKKVIELISIHKFHTVVSSGFPFTTMVLSKEIKNKYPFVRFIYDIGDPFFRNSNNGFIRDIFARYYEKKYLKYIDNLVVTNNMTLKHYINNFGDEIKQDQIEIIQMGVNLELLKEIGKTLSPINESNTYKKLDLVYAGQLYKNLREPFELYKAVEKWNSNSESGKVNLFMYGSFRDVYKIRDSALHNIYFKGLVSNEETIRAYYSSDVIVFIDNAWGMQTPGKIFEVSVIGKPVIFISDNEESPAYEVVKDFKHFFFCRNNHDDIITALKAVKKNIDINLTMKIRNDFSWASRAKQYSTLLNK